MNRSARHMRVMVVRLLAMLAAVCAIVGIRGATRANAYTGEKLTVASASDYQSYFDGGRIYFFGMIGYDGQQRRYYCMDQSQETNYTLGVTKPMPDTLVTRLMGEMLNRHQREHNVDDLQAALAFIVHDAFDTSQEMPVGRMREGFSKANTRTYSPRPASSMRRCVRSCRSPLRPESNTPTANARETSCSRFSTTRARPPRTRNIR